MKILVVAHPDDEVLWFNPEEFDHIYITFLARNDRDILEKRQEALAEHPLKDKITCFGLTESNFWRDSSKKHEYDKGFRILIDKLKNIEADEVWTHNVNGEYGHSDHILVHNACMEAFNCPVNGKNPEMFRKIRQVYLDNECWTWNLIEKETKLVDVATHNLLDFKRLAENEGMRFMLMEGNLLGAYRDGGFCVGDEDDIDLGIMDDQFDKFLNVRQRLLEIGFVEKKTVDFDNKFHGGCWERGGNHIDIMRMLKDGDTIYNVGAYGSLRYEYPAEIFRKYGKIRFLGVEVETVGDIEKFLETRYGDWRTPVSITEYSYSDPKYSPNVKRCS